jgi:hypothetical protein
VVRSYLDRLARRMVERELKARLLLVQSNGGVCSADIASRQPVRLLLSGPSGGALAALRACERLGTGNLVGIDMGGTSFDVCIVQEGAVTVMTQGEIDGLPVRLPMIEIRTIGAGGGSIASVDAGGRLTVGPRSAGARPGPVCYGRGGTLPTVTDANLVLGRLDADFFLGGALALDVPGARAAVAAQVAQPLGLDGDRAAEGILTLTNASLASAIRLSLFEKGLDPRVFSLLSFGGAGGLHAIEVAEELGIGEVVFPADASTFSASGILHSDIVHDLASSRVMPAVSDSLPEIARACAELRRQGEALLEEDGLAREARQVSLAVDMRYHGQAFELVVPWGEPEPNSSDLERLMASFHDLHRQRFSYSNPGDPVEIVTLRATATGRLPASDATRAATSGEARGVQRRRVFLRGGGARSTCISAASCARRSAGPPSSRRSTRRCSSPTAGPAARGRAATSSPAAKERASDRAHHPWTDRARDPAQRAHRAAAEMDVTVWRTSRSTIVRELLDYSTAVFDRDGYNVASRRAFPSTSTPWARGSSPSFATSCPSTPGRRATSSSRTTRTAAASTSPTSSRSGPCSWTASVSPSSAPCATTSTWAASRPAATALPRRRSSRRVSGFLR